MLTVQPLVEILGMLAAIASVAFSWHLAASRQSRELARVQSRLEDTRKMLADTKDRQDEFRRRYLELREALIEQMKQTNLLFHTEKRLGEDLAKNLGSKPGPIIEETRRAVEAEASREGILSRSEE